MSHIACPKCSEEKKGRKKEKEKTKHQGSPPPPKKFSGAEPLHICLYDFWDFLRTLPSGAALKTDLEDSLAT